MPVDIIVYTSPNRTLQDTCLKHAAGCMACRGLEQQADAGRCYQQRGLEGTA